MRQRVGFTLCLGLLTLALAASVVLKGSAQAPTTVGTFEERIARGFEIAPVPLTFDPADRDLVGLGSYIVNAQGGCNDCHTNPPFEEGGNPHLGQPTQINVAGYLAGGTSFGPFVSRNLTPRANGLPAGLEFDEFRITMRTGRDLRRRPPRVPSESLDLLQVMPWPVYRHMRAIDLRAIYEYLRAIPSQPTGGGS
jgi:hypothetical protein